MYSATRVRVHCGQVFTAQMYSGQVFTVHWCSLRPGIQRSSVHRVRLLTAARCSPFTVHCD